MSGSAAARVEERRVTVDGIETFYLEVAGDGPPTVFVHGNPTDCEDWLPFLERIEGRALALDLPGWGRSERPGAAFDGSMSGLAAFFARFLDCLGIDRYGLVIHDWGSVALIAAQEHPERVRRLVSFNSVPLTGAYRWHPIARLLWRRRGLGELFNAIATGPGAAAISGWVARRSGRRAPLPAEYVERVVGRWDRGTSRAILELYRSADPTALAAAGARRGLLGCPGLVAWAQSDPYLGPRFGAELAGALPNARLIEVERAGHWPWLDRPDLVPTVTGFLAEG